MILKFTVCLLLLCRISGIVAQTFTVKGKIIDEDTKEALAFVNIAYDNDRQSTVSNIDGYFVIRSSLPVIKLTFSYIGYNSKSIDISLVDLDTQVVVKLSRKEFELAPVTIIPGENPALRIIKNVLKNRNANNPEKMHSFSYTSYNRMHFTLQEDTTLHRKALPPYLDTLFRDTLNNKINKFLRDKYFFLMEFVSQRYFKLPDKSKEEIISSKASGLHDPSFALLGTQMQSFGFYSNTVTMLNKKYLNPISPKSFTKYFFSIQDTFITETYDTLYVISFKPKLGKNFEGLQGVLYINTNGYAIQNVIAEPSQNTSHFAIRVQQRYDLIDHKQWFPTQLNIDLLFKSFKLKTRIHELYPVGIGKTYITNIKIDPDLSNIKFSNIEVQVAEDAHKRPDSTWVIYRPLPLTPKDSLTYHTLDSIGKAKNFDQKLKSIDALMFGYFPLSIFNIDYRKYLSYNKYEGIRLGLGLMTNQKVASFFSLGGYGAYGFHDKKWKYSSTLLLFPAWGSETNLSFRYSRDVWETAHYSFLDDKLPSSSEWYRDLLITQMDMVEEKEIDLSFRMLQYLKVDFYLNQSYKQVNDYHFISYREGTPTLLTNFHFTEAGVSMKFGYKEKFVLSPSKRHISLGTNFPMIWFNFKEGLDLLNGKYTYSKYEVKISQSIPSRKFGRSHITLVAGKVFGTVPISNLYNGHGSFLPFTLEAENSFGTMRLSEFYSSEFVSLFLKQDFGSLLFNWPDYKPEVCLVTNIGFGHLRNPGIHQSTIPFRTLDNGYYESGILINRILNQPFVGMGFGTFYRYGPYSFSKIADNFAYKLTLNFNF